MKERFLSELRSALSTHEFRSVEPSNIPGVVLLLKRQTFNTNRAVVVVNALSIPEDFSTYVRNLRRRVAFRVGFFPLLWGLGMQIVVVMPGVIQNGIKPRDYVAKLD